VTHDQAEAMTLADRVAIMRDGLLQQVGPPREIYDRPANTFVGGFLGSPGMNFLRGRLSSDGAGLAWTANGNSLALPIEWRSSLSERNSAGYEDVYFGVRPENMAIIEQPDASALPATVYVSEALGNETLVRLQVGSQELVARADAAYEPAIGGQVWVKPNLSRAHLFDARNDQRIL